MSKGITRQKLYVVIYPGSQQDTVGVDDWHILHFSDESDTLVGTLTVMGIN